MLRETDQVTPIPAMGTIDLGAFTYVGNYEPGARYLNSTMTMSPDQTTVTVVLGSGSPASGSNIAAPTSMRWHTSSSALKLGGQPFCNCTVWEGIPVGDLEDPEF